MENYLNTIKYVITDIEQAGITICCIIAHIEQGQIEEIWLNGHDFCPAVV